MGRRQNYQLNFLKSSIKKQKRIYLTCIFIACGFILLPSELFRIVTTCKIANNSRKFKFIHKIIVLQREVSFIFFNLLRFNQLNNPSINQLNNQSNEQFINQLKNPSINQLNNPSIKPTCQSPAQSL